MPSWAAVVQEARKTVWLRVVCLASAVQVLFPKGLVKAPKGLEKAEKPLRAEADVGLLKGNKI